MSSALGGRARKQVALLGLLGIALVAVILIAAPATGQTPVGEYPALSVHSTSDDGARALFVWLAGLGYRTSAVEYQPFAVDPTTRVLFVLEPSDDLTDTQASAVLSWVERGGTLILVADHPNRLYARLGVRLQVLRERVRDAVPAQPVFVSPNLATVWVDTATDLQIDRADWSPLLRAPDSSDVLAATWTQGSGRVFVTTATLPFSNGGLAIGNGWAFLMYACRGVPPGGAVVFDEYHHGLTEGGTLGALLVRRPWGWAIAYSVVVVFVYLVARGRRFGPAISTLANGSRRTRGEYVATIAALLRHGRQPSWLRDVYLTQLKRDLARRFGVPADLPADAFVAALGERRPGAKDLYVPLARLERQGHLSDAAIVAAMLQLDQIRARLLEQVNP